VHGEKFIYDFTLWLRFLESKGYHNFWQDLNAKDYGAAQNRDRTFCVSFLDDVVFNFPKPVPLTKTIKDYLEDSVDEKYYITSDRAKELIDKLIVEGTIPTNERTNERQLISPSTTPYQLMLQTTYQQERTGEYQQEDQKEPAYLNGVTIQKTNVKVAKAICSRDWKGFGTGFEMQNGVIEKQWENPM
jgi:site-specific DNA-cytosine methylase